MYFVYLGSKSEWIDQIQQLIEDELIVQSTPIRAWAYITEQLNSDGQPIYVFIESKTTDRDITWLSQLKHKQGRNIYLILVGDHISKKLIYGYICVGVNEIIAPTISKEELQQILTILPRLTTKKHSKKDSRIFKLPLWKRIFDIFFATCALIFLSPILLFTALIIRMESKGPIIYASQRVGSNYNIFGFLKFRSMYTDADQRLREFMKLNQYQQETNKEEKKDTTEKEDISKDTTIFVGDDFRLTESEYLAQRKKQKENSFIKLQNDPRITKIGSIIRKYSIDELPQLINILKGDMSIVGNRPLPLYEAELLTSDEYIERFMAPAGLTGLWQVEKRGSEGILSAEERKQLDIQYAKKFSFKMDIWIIFRTFTAFIQKENV